MDYGVYDIDFTREGRRRVYLFSYLLGYSRRQYLRFVESMDLPTTLREHVQAFHHLGGVARVCLYDNFKAVVLWHDADGPLYNPKFLAFATHYGFRPQACRVRRPQTKGKVETQIPLCRDQPAQWPHLRHAGASQRGDGLVAGQRRRRARLARLQGIAASSGTSASSRTCCRCRPADFDTALVVYRHVNVEGFVAYRLNFYSVPWSYIGQVLPVRIIDERGHHLLDRPGGDRPASARAGQADRSAAGDQEPPPADDPEPASLLLRQRFGELGPVAVQFLDGLLDKQTQGKLQAQQLLALVAHYQRDDVRAALERAVRFGAFSLAAIRRILAAQAKPKPLLDELADLHRETLDPSLREEPIGPRPTSDYQHLLSSEESRDEPAIPKKRHPTNPAKTAAPNLRDQILADFTTLRIPVTAEQLDDVAQASPGRRLVAPGVPASPARRPGRPAPPTQPHRTSHQGGPLPRSLAAEHLRLELQPRHPDARSRPWPRATSSAASRTSSSWAKVRPGKKPI